VKAQMKAFKELRTWNDADTKYKWYRYQWL